MEQFNLTLRAFEQRSPNFKGIQVRGSLPEAGKIGSVQALSEYLKTNGNGSEDIQKLLTSVPIQKLIKQKRGVTTEDNLGLNWTWNVTDNLTLQGFRPGKTPDEAPLELTPDDWAAGTLKENNSFPGLFAPAVTKAQSPGDWVHKTLQARFTQQDKLTEYGTRVLSNAVKSTTPSEIAQKSLESMLVALNLPATAGNALSKDIYEFGRDVATGAPVKVLPPRKPLGADPLIELAEKQQKKQ